MSNKEAFFKHITEIYRPKGASIFMSAAMLDGETLTNAYAKILLTPGTELT